MKYYKIKDLKKLPNNPRIIKDKDFKILCKSIKDNPKYFEARPIILSKMACEQTKRICYGEDLTNKKAIKING
ncbi:MAG TPA: hypothetical protein VGB37_03120 [Candidatus Lokiarchaeia archaeon]